MDHHQHKHDTMPEFANDPDAGSQPTPEPRCWNCGYGLSGLRVDGVCPECATPIYAGPPPERTAAGSQSVLVWGIVSIATFFACIGPLAGLVAIYPIVRGNRILKEAKALRTPRHVSQPAKTGVILAWVTVGLSVLSLLGYGAFILIIAISGMATP